MSAKRATDFMKPSEGLSQRACWAEAPAISELMARALTDPRINSLAAGFVDPSTLPTEAVQQVLQAIFDEPAAHRAALQYGTTPGRDDLRAELAERASQDHQMTGVRPVPAERVVITAGSNQLLHLVAEALLDPGDIVLCAAPTYFVFLGTLQNLGARAIGVPTDAEGMIPEALEAALEDLRRAGQGDRIKAVYLVTYNDNPAGITTSSSRIQALLTITARHSVRFPIRMIADEAYRELQYTGSTPPSASAWDEAGRQVIVAGTFSKSFAPGIRVGWGILPADLIDPVLHLKGSVDFGSPHFAQTVMSHVLQRGLWRAHVERLRTAYQQKLQATLDAAREYLAPQGVTWTEPRGGLYLWLQLPEGLDAGTQGPLFPAALAHHVLYVPGALCFAAEGVAPRRNTIRLSFGVQTAENIRRGVQALGNALQQVQAAAAH